MTRRKGTKEQTTFYKTLCKKQNIEQHEPHKNRGNSSAPEGLTESGQIQLVGLLYAFILLGYVLLMKKMKTIDRPQPPFNGFT